MEQLGFVPLSRTRPGLGERADEQPILRIDHEAAAEHVFGVFLAADGRLQAEPAAQHAEASLVRDDGALLIAVVKCVAEEDSRVWCAVACSDRLGANEFARPLPLFRLEPGSLFAVGQRYWWVASIREIRPRPAPPEVADKACPVCGGRLSKAQVVQCPGLNCGRWTHLERPDEPGAEDALNCYLAAAECGGCRHPASLEPVMTPQPPEKLLPRDEEPWNELLS